MTCSLTQDFIDLGVLLFTPWYSRRREAEGLFLYSWELISWTGSRSILSQLVDWSMVRRSDRTTTVVACWPPRVLVSAQQPRGGPLVLLEPLRRARCTRGRNRASTQQPPGAMRMLYCYTIKHSSQMSAVLISLAYVSIFFLLPYFQRRPKIYMYIQTKMLRDELGHCDERHCSHFDFFKISDRDSSFLR